MKLEGKVALITGTSPNIGGGIAEGLADEGVKVVCVDIQPDNANQCAAAIVQRGGHAFGVVCDVTNEEQVKATVERALDGLKVAVLMRGFRGRPAGDVAAAVDAILAIARFATTEAGALHELDINPLMVLPKGVVAVDVLMRVGDGRGS